MDSTSRSRTFPGFERLYAVRPPVDESFRVTLDSSVYARALTRGEFSVDEPVVFRWSQGEDAPIDVIPSELVAPIIVHERVVELLRAGGFRGWRPYRVCIFGRDGVEIPGYAGLSIIGRSGPIDPSRSRTVMKQYPRGEFPMKVGMYFDPETWDGSDLFIPGARNTHVFVVEAVKRALEAGGVRGFRYEPLPECIIY
jgi:hypothetical protein